MKIGERIKARRLELGYSQEELAKKMGYKSRSTINKIELGINDITQSKVEAFAAALDTTVSYLMGWVEETKKNTTDAAEIAPEETHLIELYRELNAEGQEKLLDYAEDLSASGRYIKTDPSALVQKQA